MSDIQHLENLENEIEQSKQMLTSLSSRIQNMEAELAQLKQQAMQAQPQIQPGMQPPNYWQQYMQPQPQTQPGMQPQPQIQPGMQPTNYWQQNMQPQPQIQPGIQPPNYRQPGPQPQFQGQPASSKMTWEQRYGKAARAAQNMNQQGRPAQPAVKDRNLEGLLGKNLMGIAASVLIFISFILFAILMIPHLTDSMKVTLMLAVSIGITAFGLIMWFRKEMKSTFFISLGACGVGAIYISLFMCNAYFHIINDIILYVLILLWAAGVLVLSKYKQRLFEIIGETGIFISIAFGCMSCISNNDKLMLMVLTIYSVIGIIAFLAFRIKDDISLIIHGILGLISVFTLTFANFCIIHESGLGFELSVSLVLLAIFCMGLMAVYMMRMNDSNVSSLPIFCMISSIMLGVIVYILVNKKEPGWIAVLILCICVYCGLEIFKIKQKDNFSDNTFSTMMEIWQILELIAIFSCIQNVHDLRKYIGAAIIAIPILTYGFIKSDKISQIKGLAAFGLLTLNMSMAITSYTIFPLACFVLISVFMYMKRNEYSLLTKIVSYLLFMVWITICFLAYRRRNEWNMDISMTILMWILGLVNLSAKLTPYGKSWLTHEDDNIFNIVTYVVNAILMIFAVPVILDVSNDVTHFFAVLGAIGLYCINSVNILKKKNTGLSIYLGIKFTILVMVILSSYHAANYILSISAFVLSIIFIVIGFKLDIKSLRIYGLVVSLVCVVKLVMIDLTYDNTVGRAISFFVSGVLCFVISALYSVAEKKLHRDKDVSP